MPTSRELEPSDFVAFFCAKPGFDELRRKDSVIGIEAAHVDVRRNVISAELIRQRRLQLFRMVLDQPAGTALC